MKENKLINMLSIAKSVCLVEPLYKRKYPPLGLSKIAAFLNSKSTRYSYSSGYQGQSAELFCVSSLFTYDSNIVIETIEEIKRFNPKCKIIIGGVFASLNPDYIKKILPDVNVFTGYSKILDEYVPDYSLNWDVDRVWKDFDFVFTSRGCPNKCGYCAVWRIEPEQWVNPSWESHITPTHKNVMVSDNNLSSCDTSHLYAVIDFLSQEGKKVVFDNGFDCKHINKIMAEKLSTLKYTRTGMRLAFDRIEEDGIFQKAVETLKTAGVPKSQIMAYVLFNFKDTPREALYRMKECVKLGIRPYPQKYMPLNKLSRKNPYIGKYWTKNLLRSFRFFWLMADTIQKWNL